MKHPLTLHDDPDTPGAFIVKDADDLWVGNIAPDVVTWRNYHPTDRATGEHLHQVPPGPFETVEAAFAAFQATP